MFTVYYYPESQGFMQGAFQFLQFQGAQWIEEYEVWAIAQELNPNQYNQIAAQVDVNRVCGIKPGQYPPGNPVGR